MVAKKPTGKKGKKGSGFASEDQAFAVGIAIGQRGGKSPSKKKKK